MDRVEHSSNIWQCYLHEFYHRCRQCKLRELHDENDCIVIFGQDRFDQRKGTNHEDRRITKLEVFPSINNIKKGRRQWKE